MKDKNKTLDENIQIDVKNSEQKVEEVKEENHHHLISYKREYIRSYFMQIIFSIACLLTIFINGCYRKVSSSYTRNVIYAKCFEYGNQDLKNVAEESKCGFGNGIVQWLNQFPALEPLQGKTARKR